MSQKVKFINKNQSAFFATVRQRVETSFKEKGLSKNGNGAMWGKTAFFVLGFFSLYLLILSGWFGAWAMLGLTLALGAFAAFIGFNVCHDAIHGSFSQHARVNKGLSFLFHLVGANPYVWNITHNIVHHTYTNIPGHDEDIEVAPGLIRLDASEKVNGIQRYQHLYAFWLYGLASLSWVLRKDYIKFFKKNIGQHTAQHPRIEYFNLFFYKILHYVIFIAIPLVVLNLTWWQAALGFLVMHMAEGMVMGLVFQLAHVVEGTDFPVPNEQGNVEEAWAEHQMRTTANFAPTSALASFFLGGLNRQIEHHLFPKVCHIHYPAIAVIVRQTAQEFNLPYIESPTFVSAIQSHYRMLKKLGKEAYHLQAQEEESQNSKRLFAA
ncbi:fatty acid desaturase [Rufibacter glacialis]|uniref:Acyl-CoA desaturase n=1 Tax=Rufibacter glacialis TaxID=1259555 RepID=A0A5M8QC39_9BACT|nr:acyl-CoA desaturase [Rufibacter glacialis]KAA6432524.1 acyl-CoA desaturase [Rufibacter glacialis]GGK79457.1 fatty acid desaturase [Rufibacter glacialis]